MIIALFQNFEQQYLKLKLLFQNFTSMLLFFSIFAALLTLAAFSDNFDESFLGVFVEDDELGDGGEVFDLVSIRIGGEVFDRVSID